MTSLKSLAFTAAPARVDSPVAARRNKLLESLDRQLKLAADPRYHATRQKWQVGEDGLKRLIERPVRVKPWWRTDAEGKLVLVVRYGAKPLEFEKGKSAIAVGSPEKLSEVLGTLVSATRGGELDQLLEKSSSLRKRRQ